MKTLLQKKWFRRLCQTLLASISLLVLAVVAINWWGARLKRDAIAGLRDSGRPTSVAEMLQPMPPDEDNFAMIPLLARYRDQLMNGSNPPTDQAAAKLREIQALGIGGVARGFTRIGNPDLTRWKKELNLVGTPAECLETYDHRYSDILDELRAGLRRPETASPLLYRLAVQPYHPNLASGYTVFLNNLAGGMGFRAELGLSAGRLDIAHESLLIALRLAELMGTEVLGVSQALQGSAIRRLHPTLARALEKQAWDKVHIEAIRDQIGNLDPLNGFRKSLDLENLSSFAMFDEIRRDPSQCTLAWWWNHRFFSSIKYVLPAGWFDAVAARWTLAGLELRKDLGEGTDLDAWLRACERAEARFQNGSGWDHGVFHNSHGEFLKIACRHQTTIQQAMLACELEIYRLDHGRHPGHLQEISTRTILDTMTGEPFRYHAHGAGYSLYSIGADHNDDGGQRRDKKWRDDPDWVW